MSINTLSTTKCNIYQISDTQNSYGTTNKTIALLYSNIPCRICYLQGDETINNGKEKIIANYIIMIDDETLNLGTNMLLVDQENSEQYDIVGVNDAYSDHWQIYARLIDPIIRFTI